MKNNYISLTIIAMLISLISCDKNFEEINTNPLLTSDLDPIYQFSNAQFGSAIADHIYQGEIVQQVNSPMGGVQEGGNRNTSIDDKTSALFNAFYQGPIKNLTDVINKTKDNPKRSNLFNMARIWQVYCYQILVDTYGDVIYFDAGKGYLSNNFLPKYDDQKIIYADLIKELKEATNALNETADIVSGDCFYKGNIAKWKKLGNSLLLRAGMRYTKYDEVKAKEIVATALDPSRGGVMANNSDNAFIQFNATYTNGISSSINGSQPNAFYLGKPFVDFLKITNDPRLLYISVKYQFPANPLATAGVANTNPADQEGMPYGFDEASLPTAPGYPGKIGAAWKYSQFNRSTIVSLDAPMMLVTYSQTQLLLSEARQRGYITTSTAKDYYEAGIKGHMTQKDYGAPYTITTSQQNNYLLQTEIAFDPARALEQINKQYWISSFMIWKEAWANFRRSGYPQLLPINYVGEDPSVDANGAGGFIHRLPYSNREKSVNTLNVNEAITRMGGDNMGVRVFWDTL